jgi:hypothetical protein
MKHKQSIILLLILLSFGAFQSQSQEVDYDTQIENWLTDLYEKGVTSIEDSVFINAETSRILEDSVYRNFLYPEEYTWLVALELIKTQNLKPAFWYFINLYLEKEENKVLVVRSILAYNKILKMDQALVGSFYTYSLTDPKIGSIVNGKSKITAPQVLERKLQVLKELLYYLEQFKDTENVTENNN